MTGYVKEQLEEALQGAEIVLIPAGVPRKPGMTRDGILTLPSVLVHFLENFVLTSGPLHRSFQYQCLNRSRPRQGRCRFRS